MERAKKIIKFTGDNSSIHPRNEFRGFLLCRLFVNNKEYFIILIFINYFIFISNYSIGLKKYIYLDNNRIYKNKRTR